MVVEWLLAIAIEAVLPILMPLHLYLRSMKQPMHQNLKDLTSPCRHGECRGSFSLGSASLLNHGNNLVSPSDWDMIITIDSRRSSLPHCDGGKSDLQSQPPMLQSRILQRADKEGNPSAWPSAGVRQRALEDSVQLSSTGRITLAP
jgi:hypothetical protein